MVTLSGSAITFLMAAMMTGSLLVCLAAAIARDSFRVHGIPSWVLLFFLGGVPAGLSVPLAQLVQLADNQPIVVAGMAIVMGIGWFHTVLPSLLPDFHPESIASSGLMAVLQGIAVYLAGVATGYLPRGF